MCSSHHADTGLTYDLPFKCRWLESCDLRIGQAEADYLKQLPGGGSLRLMATLMDKDLLGGDEAISSLEAVITPESLAIRESSVLWHRLFSQVCPSQGFLLCPECV